MRMGGIDDGPRPNILYKQAGMSGAVYESNPWSNNSPNGPAKPIRRACLPSMPSNVYARNILKAANAQNQFGIGVVSAKPVLE